MIKNSSTSFYFFSAFFLFFFILISADSFSQLRDPNVDDDPNVDRVPLYLIGNTLPPTQTDMPPVTVNGFDNFNIGTDFAEPHMSHNPLNPTQQFHAFNINGAHRTYEGHEWIFSTPSFNGSVAGDPLTSYDGLGNLYYQSMMSPITGAKVIKSTNNGQTWGTAVVAISGGDKNWMACDQTTGPFANYIYTSMTNTSFNGHNFARSTDGGATWQQTFSASGTSLPGAMVAVGPNGATNGGAVYFVTNTGSAFASTYTFFRSTDGGATFQLMSAQNFSGYVGTNVGGRNSVENMRTRPYPFIAADNTNGTYRGRLYLVYASNSPAGNGNKPDIFCRYSTDQGVTWSNPVTVNDDPSSQNNHQWHPSIWCDIQTGRLYVKWMDTRDDWSTTVDDSANIYASYSDDGGQTFVQNQRVSNQKMRINCTTCGGGGTPRYQGDYDAITSYGDVSMITWTDFRNGSFASFTGYYPDFAMLVNPTVLTIQQGGTQSVTVDVPATTGYTSDAIFSATVSPPPATGSINFTFPSGNTLSSFPGNLQLNVQASSDLTTGNYTVTIEGKGPNGIPVHRRNVNLEIAVIPVELASFSASIDKNNVILDWSTASEVNNQGFEIQRRSNNEFERIGFVEGNGTTSEVQNYTFRDKNLLPGVYSYRLKQVDFDGTIEYSDAVEVDVTQPQEYFVSQNYPNPFNPTTTIKYAVIEKGLVSLKVYDVLGNEITSLVDTYQPAGQYDITFDAGNLSSGVYYYQFKAGDFTSTKKLILMK
jgi:hypothetical protein